MKKEIVLMSLFCGVMLLFGCSSKGTAGDSLETNVTSIVYADFPGSEKAAAQIAALYTEKTGIRVIVNTIPRAGYRESLLGPLSSKSDEWDVIRIQNQWVGEFAEAQFLEPLESIYTTQELAEIRADNVPDMYEAGMYGGKTWGLPWDLSTFFFFYRTDLIPNPPQTMDEYLELAKKFTKSINPNSPTNFGTVLEGGIERVNYQEWYCFLWSFGGDLFDKNGMPTFYSPEAVESLEYRYGMKNTWAVVPPDVGIYSYNEVISAFQEGIIPMAINYNAAYATFADPSSSPKIYDKFAATTIPSYVDKSGKKISIPFNKSWYLSINANSKKKEAAAQFIKFFTGYEASMVAIRAGSNPGSVKALNDPETLSLRKDASVFAECMDTGRMSPNIPEMPEIEAELGTALSQVLAGQKTAEDALRGMNETALKILKQSGKIK
jgi:multiple sugar transport system substrate-binding protein